MASRVKKTGKKAGDSLRSALDRTLEAFGPGLGERVQELIGEATDASGRLRGALDELRTLAGDELQQTRRRLDVLEQRIGDLEDLVRPKPARARTAKAAKPAARGGARKAPAKAAGAKATKATSARTTATAAGSSKAKPGARAAAKPAAKRPATRSRAASTAKSSGSRARASRRLR